MPNLVQISQNFSSRQDESPIPVISRRDYIEVISRKIIKAKNARHEQKLCSHLQPAIHTDGVEKGSLVKVCANTKCDALCEYSVAVTQQSKQQKSG